MSDYEVSRRCDSCRKNTVIFDENAGEYVCSNCGYVVLDSIEILEETKLATPLEKEKKEHVGTPSTITIHDRGLTTVISSSNRDSSGKALAPAMSSVITRWRTRDKRNRIQNSGDRSLMTALLYLKQYNDKLNGSSEALEKAAYIYRKFIEHHRLKGRSIQSMAIAALYLAFRQMGIPYNLKDMAKISNVDKKEVASCYRILLSALNIKSVPLQLDKLVARLANTLNLSEATKRRALELCHEVMVKDRFVGKDPLGIVVAVLYIAAHLNNERITQATLANTFAITQVTIRNRYKHILDLLGLQLDEPISDAKG